MANPPVFGLTGGIASGKSTVARLLEKRGFAIVNADLISRELSQEGGAAHSALLHRFGTANRAELRKLVFADESARKDLEKILHPLIRAESQRRIQALGSAKAIIYEAALLVETGRQSEFAGLIVVEAPCEDRIMRLLARDGIDRKTAERILAAQLSDEARRASATWVIHNAGSLQELEAEVERVASLLVP